MLRGNLKWRSLGMAILVGYGITLFLLLLITVIMTYTPTGERFLTLLVSAANLIGIFFAGLWSVRCAVSNGWLIGGLTGLICPALLRLVGVMACDGRYFTLQLLAALLSGFLAGALGGITGINLGYRARQKNR